MPLEPSALAGTRQANRKDHDSFGGSRLSRGDCCRSGRRLWDNWLDCDLGFWLDCDASVSSFLRDLRTGFIDRQVWRDRSSWRKRLGHRLFASTFATTSTAATAATAAATSFFATPTGLLASGF